MRTTSRRGWLVAAALLPLFSATAHVQTSVDTQLLLAAGKGDIAAVTAALDKGANVNADNGHGVTALCYAADQANVELTKVLLAHGADPNIKDLEYGKPPLRIAAIPWSDVKAKDKRQELVALLVEKGAGTEGESLGDLIRGGYYDAVRTIIARGGVASSYLNLALASAKRVRQQDLIDLLTKAGAKDPGPLDNARSPERLKLLTGVYRGSSGSELRLIRKAGYDDQIFLQRAGKDPVALLAADLNTLRSFDLKTVVSSKIGVLPPPEIVLKEAAAAESYKRVADWIPETAAGASATAPPRNRPAALSAAMSPAPVSPGASNVIRPREWASFRGPGNSGIADDGRPPLEWNAEKGVNIKWKTPIPGFAHSSPVTWGNQIFVTTAVPLRDAPLVFWHGRGSADTESGGASAYTKDDVPHSWRVYALDKDTGRIVWERVAHEGVPRTARHVMASQANATPATDGKHVVAFFGSEGLYCYDLAGKQLWKRDLGPLSSGRYLDASYEWNTASSPVIYRNSVILQLDLAENSRMAAFDLETGKDLWRTDRDEQPSWATPLLFEGPHRTELVTAAARFARGYDPDTGKELWRLGKHSALPTPTPVAGKGLIFITSGGGTTVQPIYAIRPGANGDVTLKDGESVNESVVWSQHRGGSYIPTPIVYGDILYVSSNTGIVAAYEAETGKLLYQQRLTKGGGGTYSASPVAADGKLYFTSEDGDVTVVKAGPVFEALATNSIGEVVMATPAITKRMLLFRTQHHVIAVADASLPQ